MVGLFSGIVFGAFTAFVVYAAFSLVQCNSTNYKTDTILEVMKKVASIVAFIACAFGGISVEKNSNSRYVDQYQAQKETIEASLQSDVLSGLERIQLVQQAAEANKELAGYQYDCRQWYGFAVDDRVLDLEPIDISGGAIDD